MANNAIASGSAILTANADGLKTGLDKAANDVKGWGQRVKGSMGGAGGGPGGKGGGLLGSLVGGAGLGKAVPMIAGATVALAGLGLAGEKVIGTLDDMAKQGAMAKALGMTSEQFTGIAGVAKAAGEDTKEFIESLVTMGKLGSEAAAGVGEVAGPAFKKLGLDAQAFVKLRPDEQFFAMFEALQKLGPGMEQTRLLMNAFGEDGGKLLLPLLAKTPDQLREMAKGFAITGEEMQKAAAASQAVKKLEGAAGKLWRGIAVAAAPLVEGFANFASRALAVVKPVFDWLGRAWDQTVQIGTLVWDEVGKAIAEVVDWVKGLAGEMFGWVGQLPSIQEVVVAVFRATGIAAALAWDTIKTGAGVVSFAAGAVVSGFGEVVSVFKDVVELAKTLPDELRPPGLDKFMKEVGDFEGGVKKVGKGMMDWGTGAMTGWGKSAEQFDNWLTNALKPKAAGKEAGKALGEGMKEAMAAEPIKLAGALSKGSKEAYSLIVKNQLRGIGAQDEPVKNLVKEAKKGNDLQKKGNKDLGKIADAFGALGAI